MTGYPTIPLERGDDLHNLEIAGSADLLLFMAGNQFMAMNDLLRLFSTIHPEIKKIYYETLPPGLELQQILAGGARYGGTVLPGIPDFYTSVSADAMETLKRGGFIEDYTTYLHNRIVIMVPRGNPAGIRTVKDLGRDDVRLFQPGEFENITGHILAMYREAGGEELVERIMVRKKMNGSTTMTMVHHRETPAAIGKGLADAGPVWATEAVYAMKSGIEIEMIDPGSPVDQRNKVNYFAACIKGSPNPRNAKRFKSFLLSREAQKILQGFGFAGA